MKLGRALAEVERRQGKRNDPTSSTRLTNFGSFLEKLGLTRQTAVDVQRLGTMPDDELAKAYDLARIPRIKLSRGVVDRADANDRGKYHGAASPRG